MRANYPVIDIADYRRPKCATQDDASRAIRDPLHRICNLYTIKNKDGIRVPFRPNYPQRVILHAVYKQGQQRLAVPKSRQHGISTLAAIIALDTAMFGRKQCSIVDQSERDASEKLDKCAFAHKYLHKTFVDSLPTTSNSATAMRWEDGGSIHASTRARGGTNQFLHVSEWGIIAYNDPKRSTEILTGALPSASGAGSVVLAESTFKGGKAGDWYNVLRSAIETPQDRKTRLDFSAYFFPWFVDPGNSVDARDIELFADEIDPDIVDYLDEIEVREGIKLSLGQRVWYYKERSRYGDEMFREHPSTMEEMWKVRDDGMIYAPYIDAAMVEGRISHDIRHNPAAPVYAAFDIGKAENTICWLFQRVRDRIIFLACLQGGNAIKCVTPADWVKRLKSFTQYNYGGIFLPHDGETMWQAAMAQAGMSGVACVPRQHDVWDGINVGLTHFQNCEFCLPGCDYGLEALAYYHCKTENDGITLKKVPVRDWSSHVADSFSLSMQALHHGMLVDRSSIQPQKTERRRPIHGRRKTANGGGTLLGAR